MSRFGKFVHRHVHQVERQVTSTAKQFGNFTQRAVRGVENYTHRLGRQIGGAERQWIQNVEHGAQRGLVYSVKVSPYITAVAAFILELIPFFGQILALAWVALNWEIARWTGYYAARVQGKSTQDSRNYGRTMSRRNLQSGLLGAGVGAIAAALGVTLVAAADAGVEGTALMAGEGAEAASTAANPLTAGAQYGSLVGEATEAAAPGALVGAQVGASAGFGTTVTFESVGFLANAWNWVTANPEKLLTGGYSVYQQVMKKLTPPQIPGMNFSFPGMGGRGGSGDPGGPGPGSGGGGGVSWDDVGEAALSFFEEYGALVVVALALAVILGLTL